MIIKLLILLAAFVLVYGNVVPKTSRQGSLNKYYFSSIEDPLNPVEIPPNIDEGEQDLPLLVDNDKPTMVIVHGHGGDADSTLNPLVKYELFNGGHDHNVIIVDWSSYTKQNYEMAVNAVPSVGTSLGQFLTRLVEQNRIDATTTHLVGFNLGAHVVGFAGRNMDIRPARITGLDPSKNQWGSGTPRLSRDDAVYVEVIHTDGNDELGNGIGTAIGNIDFFINGGGDQPGCTTNQCSHNRAYEVFAATLTRSTNNRLVGNLCDNDLQLSSDTCRGPTTYLGGTELVKLALNGSYRVNTGDSYPY